MVLERRSSILYGAGNHHSEGNKLVLVWYVPTDVLLTLSIYCIVS